MATLAHRFGTWCDDALNPLLVKDLRQACHGWFFLGTLLLFMLLQLLLLFLQVESGVRQGSLRAGGEVFHVLVQLLVVTTMGLLPMVMAYRLSQDFAPGEQDLFMITALTPRQIVHGKVLSAWVMTAMFYALHLPLATLTVFMRGVDFPTVFTILGGGFLFTGLIHLLVVMSVVGPMKEHSGGAMLLGGGWFLYLLNVMFQAFIHTVRTGGVRGGLSGLVTEHWPILLFLIFVAGTTYEWSVAQVSPVPANRSRGVRRFVSGYFLLSYPVVMLMSLRGAGSEPLALWAGFFAVVMLFAFPVGVAERMFPGRRVLGEMPTGAWGRPRGFLFATGVAGGVAWAMVMVFGLIVGYAGGRGVLGAAGMSLPNDMEAVLGFVGTLLYAYNIALTGFALRRQSMRLGLPDEYGSHFPMGLFLLTGILPFVAAAVLDHRSSEPPGFLYLSPFMAWDRRHQPAVLGLQLVWAIVSSSLFFPWFIEQWQAYRPLAEATPGRESAAGVDRDCPAAGHPASGEENDEAGHG